MSKNRRYDSLAVQGLVVPAGSSVLLKPCSDKKSIRDGFIRVHNVSETEQILMPSKQAQDQAKKQWPEFEAEIEGDSSPASIPMAWDNPLLKFEIISLNNSLLPGERELDNADKLTAPGSMWTMLEIICSVKPLPGSREPGAKNPDNYMGYDRTNWKVFDQPIQEGFITDVDGIITDEGLVKKKKTASDEIAYVLEDCLGKKRLAFVVTKSDGANYDHKTDSLGIFLDSIGTAGCISLLQKAIRRRPKKMRHPETGEKFLTSEIVERISRRMLCGKQTGFFLPTIGKFVTPLEHFLKRLFIIAAEDSEYIPDAMFLLSMKAYLAAKLPHWKPSKALVEQVVAIADRLLNSSVTSHYSTAGKEGMVKDFVQRAPAAVHEELGGMGGDQKMLRWLAKRPEDRNRIGKPDEPLQGCDPLDIYCDQHQDGRLICFLESPQTTKPPEVFQNAMSAAFKAASGWNTRRRPRQQMLTKKEKMVFDALRACSKMLRLKPPICTTTSDETKEWSVHDGALAGMVGSLEITLERAKYFVTVSVHDLSQFVVIPKPSRDNKKNMGDITPEQRDAVIEKAKEMLEKGVKASNIPDEIFQNATIRLRDDTWTVDGTPWSEAQQVSSKLAKPVDWSKLRGPRESHWPWTKTFGAGQTFRREVVQWCLGRMAGFGKTVTIPKINRAGAGTDEALSGLEAEGFQFLMHLSDLYPDALWPTKPFTYETKCVALRKELCSRLRSEQSSLCEWPVWSSELTLRPTQREAFEDMEGAWKQGLACFLYMLVGQGKTLSVLSFLESTRASKFIVWSLPKSAIGSVAQMVSEVGWQPVLLFPSDGLANKYKKEGCKFPSTVSAVLRPNAVTLVEHDHLRTLADSLASQMCDTAFVFDEVHKAMMSGTQRTASALRLARLAKQLVALTGTPIVDKSGYGLMEWLRLCVPFPVTASNFWVAANAMVTQLNTGEVKVDEKEVIAPESEEEKKHFKANFPARPPWFGQTETPKRDDWLQMREMTASICDRQIVDMTLKMYQEHPKDWRQDHFDALQSKSGGAQRPLLVAADQEHAVRLIDALVKKGVKPGDVFLVGGTRPSSLRANVGHNKTIHLTEQRVLDGEEQPYKIVVAALRNCEGYSLTWMTCQISGSYPSNQASRTQMRGRINRLDAQRLEKQYFTVLAGITTITHRHQEAAKLMEDALRSTPAKRKKA